MLHVLFRWAYLEVTTSPAHSDDDQAYTAGLGEALLTSDLIKLHWHNTLDGYCTAPLSPYCQRLKAFVDTNAAWMQQQLDSKGDVDPYWHQVASLIGPILWGHSGPLCHALSLLSSASSSLLWTSMRRRRATVASCNSSDTWWLAMRRVATRSGEWAQHFSNASCYFTVIAAAPITDEFC